ncbi:MAG TPA: mechanosensitive ion channel protein MscS [Vibrio sp.]|uniref:mechanosensitive ion channel family protein n=1 Tax=Vibrio TaxID=662 RepID=UPI000EE2AEE9|nr:MULTISPECIES: mechanosensitive ion channel family protein [Vibrio]HCH02055.1 mechanosensitive ion channel protein MscS [Vibrio sp.]
MKAFYEHFNTFLANHSYNWATDLLTIAVFSFFVWLIWRFVYSRLMKIAEKTSLRWDDVLIHSFQAPISTLIWCWPMLMGISVLLEDLFDRSISWLYTIQGLLGVSLVVWTLFRLVRYSEDVILESNKRDETTVQALSKVVRIIIFIIGAMTILQTLGLSLSGLLTFGGVGGLIAGLAAKDLLSNFFGGMMIYLDRPFKVNDWIRSPDRSIEGTVEKIGWRMTVIRTFDRRPLYVPNAIFSNIVVENPSRMLNRQIYETIGLRYQDANKVNEIIEEVREMVTNHPGIDERQTVIVNFDTFGDSSLNFFIYALTKTVAWVRFHEVKQDVLLKALDIVHKHGADVALPAQALHMQTHLNYPSPEESQNSTESTNHPDQEKSKFSIKMK